jgi:serine/threonine protein kinase/tetratricopeptide (TPR) repeat protein
VKDDSPNPALKLFDELVELPPDQRTRFLAVRCADPDTRREIESLLDAYDDAGGFFREPPTRAAAAAELDGHGPGTRIGSYELLETLGEGGFARVYRARQHHPVRRDVALKIIKLGMDTRAVLARFELERQALAMMDHPGIAAVYDAGVTDSGRPYFVMELVRGQRINRHCDEHRFEINQRIGLFRDVCHAVHHAHTKGILHRDLKPSNILVTEIDDKPQPKVIDFGVAKATQHQHIIDATIVTQERQVLGTPQYMSPEQAQSGGTDVDTRSDVYSLGAVLYELVTGVAPLESPGAPSGSLGQLHRLLSPDHETPRPSTRIATLSDVSAEVLSARRVAHPGELRRALRGELDWIILKCLERDRGRRYESVAALATDLEAYLEHRPIAAAPPSAMYRGRKFVQRNLASVIAGSVVLLTLLVGSIVSTTLAIRAIRAERLSQQRLDETRAANANLTAVNEFLTRDMIGSADPAVTRGAPLTVREALDKAAAAVAKQFESRPLTEASVRESIAWAYYALGHTDEGLPHAKIALDHRTRLLGADHRDSIASLITCAGLLKSDGQIAEAERLYAEAWERSTRVNGRDHEQTISALDGRATVLTTLGRWRESEPLARQAMDDAMRVLGEDHHLTGSTQGNYARVLYAMGRFTEVEPLLAASLQRSIRARGEDHPESIMLLMNQATTLSNLGRYDESEPLHRKAVELRRRVNGEDHPATLAALDGYAGLLYLMGRHEQAAAMFKDALERKRLKLGEDHPDTITAMNNYAVVISAMGRSAEAEPIKKDVLERRLRVQGDQHPDTLSAMNNYALALKSLGRAEEAEPLYRQALERRLQILGNDHPDTLTSMHNLGDLLWLQRRDAEAEPLFAELYRRAEQLQSRLPPANTATFMSHHGVCLARMGRHAEAEAPLREAHRRYVEIKQTATPRMREILAALAEVCEQTGRADEAARWRAELDKLRSSTRPTTQPRD